MTQSLIIPGATIIVAAFISAGCGKSKPSASVAEPILAAWRQGDQASAAVEFVAADWHRRPLFAPDSPYAMSEKQFAALSKSDQETKAKEFMPQIGELRDIARTVLEAGNNAAEKKEPAKARKYFTAVQNYGEALQDSENMSIIHLVGKAVKKLADDALAKLG